MIALWQQSVNSVLFHFWYRPCLAKAMIHFVKKKKEIGMMSFLVAREDKKSKLFFATQYAHTHTHTYFLSHIFLFSFSHSYDILPCRLSSKSSSSFAIALIALQPTAMTVKTLFHKEKPKSTKQLHDLLKKKSWLDNDYLLMLDWSVISWWIHWASKVWWLATSVCVCVGCIHGNKSLISFFFIVEHSPRCIRQSILKRMKTLQSRWCVNMNWSPNRLV